MKTGKLLRVKCVNCLIRRLHLQNSRRVDEIFQLCMQFFETNNSVRAATLDSNQITYLSNHSDYILYDLAAVVVAVLRLEVLFPYQGQCAQNPEPGKRFYLVRKIRVRYLLCAYHSMQRGRRSNIHRPHSLQISSTLWQCYRQDKKRQHAQFFYLNLEALVNEDTLLRTHCRP